MLRTTDGPDTTKKPGWDDPLEDVNGPDIVTLPTSLVSSTGPVVVPAPTRNVTVRGAVVRTCAGVPPTVTVGASPYERLAPLTVTVCPGSAHAGAIWFQVGAVMTSIDPATVPEITGLQHHLDP